MTDQLRDRIAAILSDTLVADDSIVKLKYGDHGTSQIVVNCNPLADAVIRDFHLTEDSGVIVGCLHDTPSNDLTRPADS